jgi:uncharacterized protein (DUF58 family)
LAEVDPRLIALCRSADNMGESLRPRAGGMDEFYGLREYRPGDSPRHIYWRRTARTGTLVAKEMMRVSPPRLLLLVDTFFTATVHQQAEVERVIAMAASIASASLESELAVGVCAWSGKPMAIPPSRGKQHREELLTLLARLPTNNSFDLPSLLEEAEALSRSGTTVLILTANELKTSLPEIARGAVVVLSAASETTRNWFRFRTDVRFD